MDSKLSEFFSHPIEAERNWEIVSKEQQCNYLSKKCLKIRKSLPHISLGTCTVKHGKEEKEIIICPHRLLQDKKIFMDCLHLLSLHEPGNELHIVPEISIPGGSVDYFVVSVKKGKVIDFIGIELQTMDTSGTVWNERQRFLHSKNVPVDEIDLSKKNFSINWKMTAKTILVQLHHKIETFESLGKHLVLVSQDCLLEYMKRKFSFSDVGAAKIGNAIHFHSYNLDRQKDKTFKLELVERASTDSQGLAKCLGLKAEASLKLNELLLKIQTKIRACWEIGFRGKKCQFFDETRRKIRSILPDVTNFPTQYHQKRGIFSP